MTSLRDHVRYLGIATMVYHGLSLLILLVIVPLIIGGSVWAAAEEPEAVAVIGGIGSILITIVLVLALPGLIGGFGLLRGKQWGKVLTIIANVLTLFSFPFGTALAVYTFWVLIREDADAILT